MNLLRSLNYASSPSYSTIVADLEFKLHSKVEISTDDTLILAYAKAAVNLVETFTNRQLLTCNFIARMDHFPYCENGAFEIPRCPVSAITAIKYYDEDNVQQTLSTDV